MKPLSIFDKSASPSWHRRLWTWLDGCPGGLSTLLVLACFIAGMWGMWLIWQLVGGK